MIAMLIARLRSLWWNIARRRDVERALDTELRDYIELSAFEYERQGLAPDQARRAARLAAGGVEQVKEMTRDVWVGNLVANAVREWRYALRSLRRSPGYVVVAVATLGIAIGSATAIFSVLNAVLLRPLPAVERPDRLITIESVLPSGEFWDTSYPDYVDFQSQAHSLDGVAAYEGTSMALHDSLGDDRPWVSYVSGNFFRVLGVHPTWGRLIGSQDVAASGDANVVVLRYDYWQRRYRGDSGVLGRTLALNGRAFTIVGVAPPGFIGAMKQHHMQLWIPFTAIGQAMHSTADDHMHDRSSGWLRLIGRLADRRTVVQARREITGIAARLARAYPEDRDRSVLVSAGAGMTADERTEAARLPQLIGIAVSLLLMIASANVAGLSLVRATAKRRELATRLALGASRSSLIRHLVAEAAVIAGVAAIVGWGVAQALVSSSYLVGTIGGVAPADVRPDGRVLSVAILVALFTVVVVAVVPALHASRMRAGLVMKDGAGGAVRRSVPQRALIILQISASLVLLAASGIVFSAFHRALSVDLGFDPRGVYTGFLDVRERGYDSSTALRFYDPLLERGAADAKLAGFALASAAQPADYERPVSLFRDGEAPALGTSAARNAVGGARSYLDVVSPTLFDVMRIPLVAGRSFSASDDREHPRVIVVDKRLAERLWPGESPLGRRIAWVSRSNAGGGPFTVVGVVGDTRYSSITADPAMVAYIPLAQHPGYHLNMLMVARGRPGAASTEADWKRLVTDVDPRMSVQGVTTLGDEIARQVAPQRIASTWIGVFGVIAVVLAAIGLYGVVAQGVLQRTRELAVRAALGATPRGVSGLVIGEGMRLALAGAAVGAAGAMLGLRALQNRFDGVSLVDARAGLAAALVLAAVMFGASYLPARRAARLNPVDALRCD
jgi:predicted permease